MLQFSFAFLWSPGLFFLPGAPRTDQGWVCVQQAGAHRTTKVTGRAVRALHTRPAHYAGRECDRRTDAWKNGPISTRRHGGCACSRRERTGRQKSWAVLCERCTHGRHTTLDVNVTDEPMQGKMGQFLPDAMVGVRAAGGSAQDDKSHGPCCASAAHTAGTLRWT